MGGPQDLAASLLLGHPPPPQAASLLRTAHAHNILHTGGPLHPGFLTELGSPQEPLAREASCFLLQRALPYPKMGQSTAQGMVQGKARYKHVRLVSRRKGRERKEDGRGVRWFVSVTNGCMTLGKSFPCPGTTGSWSSKPCIRSTGGVNVVLAAGNKERCSFLPQDLCPVHQEGQPLPYAINLRKERHGGWGRWR